jgi:hypothetical protein
MCSKKKETVNAYSRADDGGQTGCAGAHHDHLFSLEIFGLSVMERVQDVALELFLTSDVRWR